MASSTIVDDGAKNGLNSGGINHLGDDSVANSEPTMEGATAVYTTAPLHQRSCCSPCTQCAALIMREKFSFFANLFVAYFSFTLTTIKYAHF